jgi:hypothetical protein
LLTWRTAPPRRPTSSSTPPAAIRSGRAEIQAFDPDLYEYIPHLHIAVAGFIAATGVATAALAWYGARRGEWWAYTTAVAAPVLGLAVALPAHYVWGLATIGHLRLIYLATLVFVVGAALTLRGPTGSS